MDRCIYNIEYRAHGSDSMLKIQHEHTDCFEIIQTWYDHGYVTIKDKIYPMGNGNIYFINAIETHCTNPDNVASYIRNKLFISSRYMLDLAQAVGLKKDIESLFLQGSGSSCPLTKEIALVVDELYKSIASTFHSDSAFRLPMISADIIKMISIVQSNKQEIIRSSNRIIDETIAYINIHITDRISINQICEEVHVNKYYLCHLFKRITNMTISEYVCERRLSIACKLLIDEPNIPISEVAMRAGFSSFSYFNQIFKKKKGITPTKYRAGF